MPSTIGIVDLFAGPGGLGEGFASIEEQGHFPFRIGVSVEREASAHRTLTLRAFIRQMVQKKSRLPEDYVRFHAGEIPEPDWNSLDAEAWRHAASEARCLELGTPETSAVLDTEIDRISRQHDDTILIGGPPCQAYSLVGRSRSRGIAGYRPELDDRHFLFREYVHVLDRLRPAAFVLENVKGVLSSKVDGEFIFEQIMEDLASLGGSGQHAYELHALALKDGALQLVRMDSFQDFIVRAELLGIPQRRHRVIVIGIRADLCTQAAAARLPALPREASVADAIGDLTALRSGLSKTADSPAMWQRIVTDAARDLGSHFARTDPAMSAAFVAAGRQIEKRLPSSRQGDGLPTGYGQSNDPLRQWLENRQLRAVAQHQTRGHMDADLARYLFAAVHAQVNGSNPKREAYPAMLAPAHRSWDTGIFSDRFRVQLAERPSTTITSHISKDGHYFIHPDPAQCRSLTVREAARLQTFPDDYIFLGNRTQQYVQVGNAVPPYLARQIAQLLLRVVSPLPEPSTSSDSLLEATA
ncbi:DNA cytosine methyltransferase [Sphingopyxis sp. 22461]|uniref:DNA cytosine methyltransferase n=1 Tax=Sphingopyxis sp. 22461 TaxID=3453923 RepID=UPI003F874C97